MMREDVKRDASSGSLKVSNSIENSVLQLLVGTSDEVFLNIATRSSYTVVA